MSTNILAGDVVRKGEDGTITGQKTFSRFPVLPSSSPGEDDNAVTKRFVLNNVKSEEEIRDVISAILDDGTVGDIVFTYADDSSLGGTISATIEDEVIDDRVNALLTAGSNITLTYNDSANSLEIASTGAGDVLSSDTTVDLDSSMSAADIQAEIDAQPACIPSGRSLTFQFADGTYTLTAELDFSRFYGSGEVNVFGNGSETDANAQHTTQGVIFNCSGTYGVLCTNTNIGLDIRNIKFTNSAGMRFITAYGLYMRSLVQGCYFDQADTTGTPYSIALYGVGYFQIKSCLFSGGSTAIYSSDGGWLRVDDSDDTGTVPEYGLGAHFGAFIRKVGTVPAGSISNELTTNGGAIY